MQNDNPASTPLSADPSPAPAPSTGGNGFGGFVNWIKTFIKPEAESSLRETIDEYINVSAGDDFATDVSAHERLLLANILKLKDKTVTSVMIPRADIVAVEINTTEEELLSLLSERQYSRLPVYRGTLDDVLGTIHIKDLAAAMAKHEHIELKSLLREIPVISPAMHILDLLITMRESKRHMALVVDEFGGIDGLVTVNDVLESIVGEIDDEHDSSRDGKIVTKQDGSFLVDARLSVEELETFVGPVLTSDERNAAETLSGLLYAMEGRIPSRGEVLKHSSGVVFEIMDADARRINLVKVTNIPKAKQ